MTHSDNKGLVLPPKVAPLKVVIIPCGMNSKTSSDEQEEIIKFCNGLSKILQEAGIKTCVDSRTQYRVGWKFNHWELRGIPIRLEVGKKEIQNHKILACRRDILEKNMIDMNGSFCQQIMNLLEEIQQNLFLRAQKEMYSRLTVCNSMDDFTLGLKNSNMCLVPWCEGIQCEKNIIENCKKNGYNIKSLCIPMDGNLNCNSNNNSEKCLFCSSEAKSKGLFGASF